MATDNYEYERSLTKCEDSIIEYEGSMTATTTLDKKKFSATKVKITRYISQDGDLLAVKGDDADWNENFLVVFIPVQEQTSGTLEVSERHVADKATIHFNRYLGGEDPVRRYAHSGKIEFKYDKQNSTVSGSGYFEVQPNDVDPGYKFENLEFLVHPAK